MDDRIATFQRRFDISRNSDVALDEFEPAIAKKRQQLITAEDQVVENPDTMSTIEQLRDEARPHIARAAGHEYLHFLSPG